jgi:hypothetical protein
MAIACGAACGQQARSVGSASGNDDAKTRGLAFIHCDKEKMSVSETEDGDFGRIVKIDRRQIAKVRWDVKPQIFGL